MVPQIAGMGDPPEMMSWSEVQVWSVVPGWATTKLSKSNLQRSKSIISITVVKRNYKTVSCTEHSTKVGIPKPIPTLIDQ